MLTCYKTPQEIQVCPKYTSHKWILISEYQRKNCAWLQALKPEKGKCQYCGATQKALQLLIGDYFHSFLPNCKLFNWVRKNKKE